MTEPTICGFTTGADGSFQLRLGADERIQKVAAENGGFVNLSIQAFVTWPVSNAADLQFGVSGFALGVTLQGYEDPPPDIVIDIMG